MIPLKLLRSNYTLDRATIRLGIYTLIAKNLVIIIIIIIIIIINEKLTSQA